MFGLFKSDTPEDKFKKEKTVKMKPKEMTS